MVKRKSLTFILLLGITFAISSLVAYQRVRSAVPVEIILIPKETFQTISGWEATSQSGETECSSFPKYKNQLFDLAVKDLGINRIRLELSSVVENPVDYFSQYQKGQISADEWRKHRQEGVNDNNNPDQANLKGFHFSSLDNKVDLVVLPLKQRIEAKGEKLFVNLNYVDFNAHPFEHRDYPQEYGELLLVTFQHLQSKYGWTPDAVEIILEPDTNAAWSGQQIGEVLIAAGSKLKANGFSPDFIAPSTTKMSRAPAFFDQMLEVPGVLTYLKEISYHRYSGVSEVALQEIAKRAEQNDLRTAMLEHIGSGYQDLHEDLKVGGNSAWQQYTLAYCTEDNGAQYYWIDQSSPDKPVVNLGERTKMLRQYFKYIRRGAVRIGASTNDDRYDPLAFINTNGKYVVVVKASQKGDLIVAGLPAGAYGIMYTTQSEYDRNLLDITLQSGQSLSASIPGEGVITIYAKTPAGSLPIPEKFLPFVEEVFRNRK